MDSRITTSEMEGYLIKRSEYLKRRIDKMNEELDLIETALSTDDKNVIVKTWFHIVDGKN